MEKTRVNITEILEEILGSSIEVMNVAKDSWDELPEEARDHFRRMSDLVEEKIGNYGPALVSGITIGLDLAATYPKYAQKMADWYVPVMREGAVPEKGIEVMTDCLVREAPLVDTESEELVAQHATCPSCGQKAREGEVHDSSAAQLLRAMFGQKDHEKPVRVRRRKNGN